ncbi:MAG: zinc-ribbon domain-containing protein [Bacteroidales bacterium]|nr:zinc-ribbon domain-containing protein [Bacteroidales bacterium]
MFCKYCGEQISDDSVFCSKCGKKLTESITEKKLDSNNINPQKEEKIVIEATIKPTNNDSSETKSEGIKWISTDNLQWQRPKKARIAQICIYVLLGLLSAFFLWYCVEEEELGLLIAVAIPILIAFGFTNIWKEYTRYPNAYDIIPKDVADQIEEYEWNGFCKTKYIFFKKDEKYGVIDTRNYCVKIEEIFDSISWRVPNKTIDVTIKNKKNTINILSYRNRNNLDTTISNSYIDSSLQTLKEHFDSVNSVAYSPDGTKIISGLYDKTIKIWDAITGECLKTLEGHSFPVNSVAFSPDGTKIVSGSYDETIKIWDANTGKCLKALVGHTSSIYSVAYSPDGTKIISGSYDKTIKIWDANIGQCLKTLEGHSQRVNSVSYSPDGTKIVSGSDDKTIKIWGIE